MTTPKRRILSFIFTVLYYHYRYGYFIVIIMKSLLTFSFTLFVCFVFTEARAAFEAGYTTAVSVRPGNAALSNEDKKDLMTVSSFNELFIEERPHQTKKSKGDD